MLNGMAISIHALLAESDMAYTVAAQSVIAFLSTLSLRRATVGLQDGFLFGGISIHALLAESDAIDSSSSRETLISIHALLAESDAFAPSISTPAPNFYPRSPCGERRRRPRCSLCCGTISIHALLAESDHKPLAAVFINGISIHALLAESDRVSDGVQGAAVLISIHALLAESDRDHPTGQEAAEHFYPRSPCGERRT